MALNFNFSTRTQSLTLFITVSTCIQLQNLDSLPNSERLDATWIWQDYPKPFQKSPNSFELPRGFTEEKAMVEKTPLLVKTFLHLNPRAKESTKYPKNIQDMIGSMGSSSDVYKNVYFGNISSMKEDQLEMLKDFRPSDPGEVNLLGPASLRFVVAKNHDLGYSRPKELYWDYQSGMSYLPSKPFAMIMKVYPARKELLRNQYMSASYNMYKI
ncbi:uncharacterized protein LOC126742575 isoform X2 [Anthonomus grandis grandis]|uniref:uncharacterized protein LOC126742575 isoform X2 n=1 Tax=Anthonomus grandis grandis TaxID=2921223 RepID=UPI0021652B63|nr:uncharacterized protein LOC126742575 isoform X2 [Anthonomus grandis grandis]